MFQRDLTYGGANGTVAEPFSKIMDNPCFEEKAPAARRCLVAMAITGEVTIMTGTLKISWGSQRSPYRHAFDDE